MGWGFALVHLAMGAIRGGGGVGGGISGGTRGRIIGGSWGREYSEHRGGVECSKGGDSCGV